MRQWAWEGGVKCWTQAHSFSPLTPLAQWHLLQPPAPGPLLASCRRPWLVTSCCLLPQLRKGLLASAPYLPVRASHSGLTGPACLHTIPGSWGPIVPSWHCPCQLHSKHPQHLSTISTPEYPSPSAPHERLRPHDKQHSGSLTACTPHKPGCIYGGGRRSAGRLAIGLLCFLPFSTHLPCLPHLPHLSET